MNRWVLFVALAAVLGLVFSGSMLAGTCDGKSKKGTCEAGVTKASTEQGEKKSCHGEGVAPAVTVVADGKKDGCCGTKAAAPAVTVVADGKKDGCCGTKAGVTAVASQTKEGCGTKSSCSGVASVACSTKYLPAMTYKVGEQTIHCPKEAKSLADAAHTAVVYVVGEKTFTDQREAMTALADATDACLASFTKVAQGKKGCGEGKTCPMTGKPIESEGPALFTVAGRAYDCPTKAEKASKIAAQAMTAVALKYRVGDKELCCGQTAESIAKETGAPILYVVGEESTPCNVTARLMLARMKVEAADRALREAGLAGVETAL